MAFNNDFLPLFRVEKKNILESKGNDLDARLGEVRKCFESEHQWVIVAGDGGVVLRNPDHLFPVNVEERFSKLRAEFIYAVYNDSEDEISSDFWAVSVKYFDKIESYWRDCIHASGRGPAKKLAWTEFVKSLPLKKRKFEPGEVFVPRLGVFDAWKAMDAAFVVLANWPDELRWKYLQALYYGTYYGDKSGLILDVLDP